MPLSQQFVDSDDDSSHSPAPPQSKPATKVSLPVDIAAPVLRTARKQKVKREPEPESSEDKPLKKKAKKEAKATAAGSPPPTKDKKPVQAAKKDDKERRKVGDSRRASTDLLTDDKGDKYVDLGKNKRAVVSNFKGKTLIQIREYYNDAGEWKPGKKGIALPVEAWDRLKKAVGVIDDAIDDLV
ncbi:hypothetical protein JCM3770_001274 [Rhodotorula araucariae]